MAIQVTQGGTVESTYESGVTGQVGTVAVRVDDNEGATVFGPTVLGISELGATGVYVRDITAPGVAGTQWSILWSLDGTFDDESTSVEDLFVVSPDDIPDQVPVLEPIADEYAASVGPCQAWTSADAVAECCSDESDTSGLDGPVVAASQVLYLLSGSQWSGMCSRRVRPCASYACRGLWDDFGVYGRWREPRPAYQGCGCRPMSRVELPGHAREILEVTIDGAVVDASTYRLDENRWLTRVPDPADPTTRLYWPGCQDMELAETEDDTFSVLYAFGVDPPYAGVLAARELACAIHATCAGGGSAADCPLPSGIVKIVRQGVTIELSQFAAWGQRDGVWMTGLPLTDLFLNTYNPTGQRSKARVWSPDMRRFARPIPGATD